MISLIGSLQSWRATVTAMFLVIGWIGVVPPANPVYIDPPGVEISKEVIEFLEKNGVKPENWSNFLNNARKYLGDRWREFLPRLTQAGTYPGHPVWRDVIKGVQTGRIAGGFVAAEVLLGAIATVEIAHLFYTGGHACGITILDAMDVDGVVANQESFNNVTELLREALASGRWRLKPGWTHRDAMLQVLINMKTNRCPYFVDLIEPVVTMSVTCPPVSSRERAQILRDENQRKYQDLLQRFGAGDARTQEALGLYNCYQHPAGP